MNRYKEILFYLTQNQHKEQLYCYDWHGVVVLSISNQIFQCIEERVNTLDKNYLYEC